MPMNQETLFDGDQETLFATTFEIAVNGTTYYLRARDFEPLLSENTAGDVLRRLVQMNEIRPIGYSFKGFNSADGLQLYQTVREGHLIVIAFGEKQPMRFILTLEGIFPLADQQSAPYLPAKRYKVLKCKIEKTDTAQTYPQLRYEWVDRIRPFDRAYARIHPAGLPDDLDLSGVLRPFARKTDFISADFLALNGFFVRQSVVDILQNFDLPETTIYQAVAYHNKQPQPIFFVYTAPTALIDYELSLFEITGHALTGYKPQRLTLPNTEAFHAKMRELVQSRSDGQLIPRVIQLKGRPDVFKLPRNANFYFSAELQQAFQAAGITGYELKPLQFLIG